MAWGMAVDLPLWSNLNISLWGFYGKPGLRVMMLTMNCNVPSANPARCLCCVFITYFLSFLYCHNLIEYARGILVKKQNKTVYCFAKTFCIDVSCCLQGWKLPTLISWFSASVTFRVFDKSPQLFDELPENWVQIFMSIKSQHSFMSVAN